MNIQFINAFIQAIENVYETMLHMKVQVGQPTLKKGAEPRYDVSGIIGISGDVVGVIVLSFPVKVAEQIASTFTGGEVTVDHEDFSDAIGEVVNMVSGNAKAKMPNTQSSISCPTVIVGEKHQVMHLRQYPAIELPCTCPAGEFVLEVSLKNFEEVA